MSARVTSICVMGLGAESSHRQESVDGSREGDRWEELRERLDLVIQREVVVEIDCEGDRLFQSHASQSRIAIACRLS